MSTISIIILSVIVFLGGILVGYFGHSFFTSSNDDKIETIKKILLYLVAEAEKSLGSGTGDLKLAKVYKEFIEQFPELAEYITYDQFKTLVEEVLDQFENLIENNANISAYIKGDAE